MRTRYSWAVALSAAISGIALIVISAHSDAAGSCDRACLQGTAEKYLSALLAHDPSKGPLAHGVRYSENGVELPLPDGLWRTVSSIASYRLFVSDPKESTVGFFIKAEENGAPLLVGTRLKISGGLITEIESNVSRLGTTIGGGPGSLPREDLLGDAPRKQFVTTQPPGERHTREQLIAIANSYFTGIENNSGEKPPPFADDCLRLENGSQTTGRPVAPGGTPGPANYSCKEAFSLGYYREDTRLRNRRFVAVDEERGLVYGLTYFDHDAALRTYKLKDGRTVTVRNTAPWTWCVHEIFQISARGEISQVEAVLLSVPYGMRPAWSTGVHMPSPQAVRDGFKEY
ncbi:MAG TPA: hypothetical protein VLW26_01370 [Steroidobacteraceae bacterium]|nr:hypothetical protein [Steroidobacteraceae bacterium]